MSDTTLGFGPRVRTWVKGVRAFSPETSPEKQP